MNFQSEFPGRSIHIGLLIAPARCIGPVSTVIIPSQFAIPAMVCSHDVNIGRFTIGELGAFQPYCKFIQCICSCVSTTSRAACHSVMLLNLRLPSKASPAFQIRPIFGLLDALIPRNFSVSSASAIQGLGHVGRLSGVARNAEGSPNTVFQWVKHTGIPSSSLVPRKP